ncbi:uncharacterized protein BDZ99DRAFT_466529 [Mytilinidion resinicola]|uniref:LysM domain-containing protein n=1 Tax=Mytilinidion resinicola TaxID=574789 RepID=A0A6A6Y9R7_9PEZI|nr:uncharacterized protein BDZ99DRAFT_466529 [Mytilinidion resinicola]KAF2805561.1 hypothetical protein BDZ99DRAFT_466529 [Mytilinidion resinicola]
MNPTTSHSSKTSSTPTASSLRPRNRRLISGLDDESDVNPTSGQNTGKSSPFASPFTSRAASPMPSTNLSRAESSRTTPRSNLSGIGSSAGIFGQASSQEAAAGFSGLLGNSWSAIQGLASNVLGSDTSPDGKQSRRRRPLQATHRRTASSAPPKQWGPSASSGPQIGAGSQEERENMVRALKRRDLLAADGDIYPDAVGRIKRRNSDERLSTSAPPAEQDDRDALVYVHRVRPEDTLVGITIRYNCQPAVLRKANRMWPNDTVQTRKTIVLPVDACGVKGRPVSDHSTHVEDDLLLGGYGDSTSDSERTPTQTPTLTNGWHSTNQITSAPRPHSSTSNTDSEPPWKHESWVMLPNDANPTEVARLPRRTLGFFPPARRKSLTFSDTPTASSSFDLPRSSLSTVSSHAHSPSLISVKGGSTTTITPIASNSPPTRPGARQRTSSLSQFHLHGPGGVGTMGKNVRSPGPAQDGLNKLFASHLPSVAPPPGQEYFTPWNPGLVDDAGLYGSDIPSSFQTANSGGRVAGGGGIDLENVGGAIESWMRKMAKGASTMLEPSTKNGAGRGSAVPVIGVVGGDMGDLIELRDDAFDVGGGGDDDEDELGRGRRTTDSLSAPSGSGLYGSGRADLGAAVRDRGRGRSGGTKKD